MKLTTVAGTALALMFGASAAQGQTIHLPITAFTSVQNSAQAWQDPETGYIIVFDAYGRYNTVFGLNLNTQVGGDVSINDLGDGTQRVLVNLHTKNALCYGTTPAGIAFGYFVGGVPAGSTHATGDGMFRLEFTMPAGAPMPQWGAVLGPNNDAMATASISCKGDLRPNTLTGITAIQTGMAHTTQTGLYDTGANGGIGCPPEQDANCFPSEKVQFKPVGKRN